MQTEEISEDLLTIEQEPVRADTGKRLANYLIDLVSFYIVALVVGVLIALISPSVVANLGEDSGNAVVDRIISLGLYGLYMSIIEALFKGKSLGKLITGTRAVNMDGSRISVGTAFARGFSKAVPFCVFSALGTPCNPWQDRWTDTMVMDEKKSAYN